MTCKNYAVALFSILTIGVSAVLAGCANERGVVAAPPEIVTNVSVIVVQETTAPDWLDVVGTVRAAQTSQVSSQMMGNIVQIRAHEGDRVQRGQVLAILDDAQPQAAEERATAALDAANEEASAAESDLTLAETTLKRYQQLYDKKSVSPQEFDEVKARYQSAEAHRDMARAGQSQANATLTQARTSLGYTRICAPFAGIVTQKMADEGTLASPGMPLFTLEDTRSYRLEVSVDESDIHDVLVGETTPVSIDALGNVQLAGKVVEIVPAADPSSRSFLAKIGLPLDARLRSGLFGRARFSRGHRSALLIPQTATIERGELFGVYVIDSDGIARLRYVTLGAADGQNVEVLSGLQGGERLIASPGTREFNGKRIVEHP